MKKHTSWINLYFSVHFQEGTWQNNFTENDEKHIFQSSIFYSEGTETTSTIPDDGIKHTQLNVWRREQLRACVRCTFNKIQKQSYKNNTLQLEIKLSRIRNGPNNIVHSDMRVYL